MNKKNPSSQKVLLVDASSVFFRAYYAIPYMLAKRDSKKKPLHTNAVYGYITTTLKILDRFHPQYIVYCFDRPEKSHRVKYYKEYKANRDEMPEDLEEQIPYIKKVTDSLGIKRMELKGYEADDLIGSLASWLQKNKYFTTIISSDKDFTQLVSEHVEMFDPMKEVRYDSSQVQKKWGILPGQVVDYLAMVGDVSDNIPGVKGVGGKGAQKLLSRYQTLENIYENLGDLPPKLSQKFESSKKLAKVSQKLARIVLDLKLISRIDEIKKNPIHESDLKKLLSELEFTSIHRKMFPSKKTSASSQVSTKSSSSQSTIEVSLSSDLKKYPHLKKIKKQTSTEEDLSRNLDPYCEVGICLFEKSASLLVKNSWIQIPNVSFKKLGQILSYKRASWWGYDLKNIWHQCGALDPIASFDLMVSDHLITSKPSGRFKNLVQEVWSRDFDDEENSILYMAALREIHQQKLKSMDLINYNQDVELKTAQVLYKMERAGILVDQKKLYDENKKLNHDLLDLENKIFKLAGHPFNVSSPQQLAYVLFDEMGLKKGRKTKTGYSTDGSTLMSLIHSHPIIQAVLDYRELFKLKTTYVEGLLGNINEETLRVHTHFKQTLTSTGRLSSVRPNLQNIPIKTPRGREIRKAFIAKKDCVLIGADYSQIELRVLAHFSDDPSLKQSFSEDQDIHQATASFLFRVPMDQVSEDQRSRAKAVNFGITYGQGAFGLSESLGLSHQESQEIIDRYFTTFKKVKEYIQDSLKLARKKCYVETLLGRRRMIPELLSKNVHVRKFGERAAINTIMQGTASDLVKMAMIQLSDSLWSQILLQVHDELLFECPQPYVQGEIQQIKKIMENVSGLNVPLKVRINQDHHWQKAGGK